MNMQEGGPLHGPEDMLAQAEGLAARYMSGGRSNVLATLPRWARDLLWALRNQNSFEGSIIVP